MNDTRSEQHGFYTTQCNGYETKSLYRDGLLLNDWEYPLISRPLRSPLLNDFNLHFSGDWTWPEADADILVNRVINGLKPAGFTIGIDEETVSTLEQETKEQGLWATMETLPTPEGKFYGLSISQEKLVSNLFDLNAVKDVYHDYYEAIKCIDGWDVQEGLLETFEETFSRLSEATVDSVFEGIRTGTGDNECDEQIKLGLVMGYPVECTISGLIY